MTALMPFPPHILRERVAGTADVDWFCRSGARTTAEWQTALSVVGRDIQSFDCIVDFGCGCGRTLTHLKPLLKEHQKLIGADPDKEAIDWVAKNYPGVTVMHIGEIPPVTLEHGAADLIVNHSVFTHLPEHIQDLWIDELARILRTGGFAVISFHGEKAYSQYIDAVDRSGDVASATKYRKVLKECGHLYIMINR